jgi:predicted transcriptional regulator
MASITIEVPQELKLELDDLAQREGVAPEDVVERAIKDHLFVRQFRSMRERMTAKARSQGIVTDEDVFDRVS